MMIKKNDEKAELIGGDERGKKRLSKRNPMFVGKTDSLSSRET